jgi:hypothetical protein
MARTQRTTREFVAQRLPVDQLARHVDLSVGFLERVDRRDVRVDDGGRGPRLALQPRDVLPGVVGTGDGLERHGAAEARVFCLVHDAHAARADDAAHAIGTDGLCRQRRQNVGGGIGVGRRAAQPAAGPFVHTQQRRDFVIELFVVAADGDEPGGAILGADRECPLEQVGDARPAVRIGRSRHAGGDP